MKNVVCFILGGGTGSRLMPLTAERSKPAVPLGGKYRLIDIPISNCMNSGVRKIYLLTQFNSVSLHRHIREAYKFDAFGGGYVEILAAQQTHEEGTSWYQGTADAVRKQIRYLQQPGIDYVLVLSGDQLYRMDFRKMLKTHQEHKADATIAALPMDKELASQFGIMRLNEEGRVAGFLEKPKTDKELSHVKVDTDWIEAQGVECRGREYLASMGIYLFNRDLLVDALLKTPYKDFGKEVFPAMIHSKRVQTYLFDDYWEDIGTIKAFYDCNLALASSKPPFNLHDPDAPIYTRARFLPATRVSGSNITNSLISDGCLIGDKTKIENSLIGLRGKVGTGTTIRNTVMMGDDFYRADKRAQSIDPDTQLETGIGIGSNTLIDGAILDKNCYIGDNVVITLPPRAPENGRCGPVIVRDGIIVVPRGCTLPNGWKMDKVEPVDF